MPQDQPLITLNNNIKMPQVGYGVFRIPPEQTAGLVQTALQTGYRLIDTAAVYGNEAEVGQGIRSSGIDRAEIFVTTKLWITEFGYEQALKAFEASRQKLGLDYVDLYLIHWPVPTKFDQTIAAYQALEKLLADGLVRSIGVSNFTPEHLDALIEQTNIVPAVNQIELHPFLSQEKLRETHAELGILSQAWSPIGGSLRYSDRLPEAVRDPLKNPTIKNLAEKYDKSPAQVILRWQIEQGIGIIPKSANPDRVQENFALFDFGSRCLWYTGITITSSNKAKKPRQNRGFFLDSRKIRASRAAPLL